MKYFKVTPCSVGQTGWHSRRDKKIEGAGTRNAHVLMKTMDCSWTL